jgi:hypothetical protein
MVQYMTHDHAGNTRTHPVIVMGEQGAEDVCHYTVILAAADCSKCTCAARGDGDDGYRCGEVGFRVNLNPNPNLMCRGVQACRQIGTHGCFMCAACVPLPVFACQPTLAMN